MTGLREAVELYINLNLTLLFALLVWLVLRTGFRRSRFKFAYNLQFTCLKILIGFVAISPVLSWVATRLQETFAPGQSLVISDLIVAAYLRGDIAVGAIEFERFLNMRDGWTEGFLSQSSPVFSLVAAALIVGLAVFAIRFGRSTLQVRRILSDGHVLKRIGRVDLRVSQHARVPMAARGLFRLHVILPYEFDAAGKDRQMALAHELQHFRNRDLEWEIALEMLRPFFFWNPAFVLLKRQFDKLRELSCDEAVLVRRGFDPFEYAMCLLRFCERALNRTQRRGLNVALVSQSRFSARRDLSQRLLSLKTMGGVPRLGLFQGLGFAVVLGLGFSLFAASIQTHKDWTHDRLMLSTVVNLERLEAINAGF